MQMSFIIQQQDPIQHLWFQISPALSIHICILHIHSVFLKNKEHTEYLSESGGRREKGMKIETPGSFHCRAAPTEPAPPDVLIRAREFSEAASEKTGEPGLSAVKPSGLCSLNTLKNILCCFHTFFCYHTFSSRRRDPLGHFIPLTAALSSLVSRPNG